ncbi:hypothetical protein [Pontibacter ramchanderi]|uniref:hypothetical protein n=1 Tax=Pontibacter ramchanderi TaxID=1179743 RepID=UPI00117BFD3D|nr:hypothetical protein [Pontibacter ramchanderi]
MQTITKPKTTQEKQKRKSSKGKSTAFQPASPLPEVEDIEQGEGLYEQVRQDEQLRLQHVAKLLATPGYSHLSDEVASDMVDQMLRLSTLLYELVLAEDDQQEQTSTKPVSTGALAQTK